MSADTSLHEAHAPAGAPAAGAAPLGEQLSRARAARGYSVEDVASQLKFAARQIAALEAGRLDEIPGGAFARGMVRGYARLLRVDSAPLLAQLPLELPDAESLSQRFSQPVPFSDPTRRLNVVYAALALVALLVAAWVVLEWREPAAPITATQHAAPAAVPAAQSAPAAAAEPAPAGPATATPAAAEPRAVPVPKPAKTASRRVVLRFERESWVQVRDAHGRTLLAQLNPAGTEQVLDSDTPLSFVIGNAQHVRLSLDGQPVDLRPFVKVEVARLTLP